MQSHELHPTTPSPNPHPQVPNSAFEGIRKGLDSNGFQDVSVSQDPNSGLLSLCGKVNTESEKALAGAIANSAAGEQVVTNKLDVINPNLDPSTAPNPNLDPNFRAAMAERAKATPAPKSTVSAAADIRTALDQTNLKAVLVTVDVVTGGFVLGGRVTTEADKSRAEVLAKTAANTSAVSNKITVTP